jgi:16S rRNA processing protein RimM
MDDFITIGQIINTHGLKGELKIYPLTDDMKRFRKLKTVFINRVEHTVVWCKLQTNKVVLKIEGIDSIEEAEKYKRIYLEVKREEAVKLPKGRYFVCDIKKCTIYDTEGNEIGPVLDVIFTKNNDVYWVKKEKKDIMIPVLSNIVESINIEDKKIIIRPIREWSYED